MHSAKSNRERLKAAGWFLSLSPLPFVVVVITAVVTLFGNNIGSFDDITPEQMSTIRVGWIVFHFFLALAFTFGGTGLVFLSQILYGTHTRALAVATLVCALAGIISVVAVFVLRASLIDFATAQLELMSGYRLSNDIISVSQYLITAATALAALGLSLSGLLRRTGLLVTIVTAVYGIADLTGMLELPPFVIALFWLILGIALILRKPVIQTSTTQLQVDAASQ